MRVIFFLKIFKIKSKFQKLEKKIEKNFFFVIIASKDVAVNGLY